MAIDLSRLPPPDIIESLSYEQIRVELLADFAARCPGRADLLESDPAVKLIEVYAYREMLLRQRVNDTARSVMVATANGMDLDHAGARFNTARLVIDPGDPTARPPRAPIYESDVDYRARIPLAMEAISTAGPTGAYEYWAKAAHGHVKDAKAFSPSPGLMRVVVLSRDGDGSASAEILSAVTTALSSTKRRPLCDTVEVVEAEVIPYVVRATLHLPAGPDQVVVEGAARAAVATCTAAAHALAGVVAISGLSAALHQPGVSRVTLRSPSADIVAEQHQAPWCSEILITVERVL